MSAEPKKSTFLGRFAAERNQNRKRFLQEQLASQTAISNWRKPLETSGLGARYSPKIAVHSPVFRSGARPGIALASVSVALLTRLHKLKAFAAGWDGDNANAISASAVDTTKRLIEHLASSYLNFCEPTIVPKYDGLLQVEWHSGDRTLEMELMPDGWEIMGAIQEGERMKYFSGASASEDWATLEEFYCWWADGRLVWPLR